jgi:LPS-assembly protein
MEACPLFSSYCTLARRALIFFLLTLTLGMPLSTVGQQTPAGGTQPIPTSGPSEGCGQQAVQIPLELRDTESTVNISAASQEKDKDTYRLRGHVEVTYQGVKLTADEASYNATSGEVVANGHVTLTDSSAHLEADEAHYNIESGKGWLSNGRGYIQAKLRSRPRALVTENPLYVRAARVERQSADVYTVRKVHLSSCSSESKGWSVAARSARLDVGDKVVAHGAGIRFLRVPVLYTPIFAHSLAQNPRHTGFLLPNLGHSSQKGFIVGDGFFWTINTSADLLLGLQNYSLRGLGGIGRFRARPSADSEVRVDYFGVNDKGSGPLRQSRAPGQTVRATGQARDLFHGFRGVLDVDYLSSLAFRQTFTDSFAQAVASEVHQTGFLTKNFDGYSVNFYVSRYQNFLCAQSGQVNPNSQNQICPFAQNGTDSITIRQSPSVSVTGIDKQLGRSPFYFEFDSSAAGVARTEPGFSTPRLTERLDFFPNVLLRSKPFLGFHLTPSVGVRATRYGTSLRKDLSGLDRFLGDFSLDLRPPSFEKIFAGPHWGYRLKHVIEPEVRYRLVRSFNPDSLRDVVRYDSVDIFSETNEIEYSLTNSLFMRRDVPDGSTEKPQARELVSLRVSQKYYFDPTFGGALEPGKNFVFEPAISLTGFAFAQGRRLSPIVSVLKFSPFSDYDTQLSADINPSGGGVRDIGLTSHVRRGPLGLAFTEFFINSTAVFSTPPGGSVSPAPAAPVLKAPSFNLLRTTASYGDVNRKGFSAALGLDYNLDQRIAHQIVSQVSYNFGCFGIDFEFRRFELGTLRRENQFRFALSLANIGTFGNLKPRERLY